MTTIKEINGLTGIDNSRQKVTGRSTSNGKKLELKGFRESMIRNIVV